MSSYWFPNIFIYLIPLWLVYLYIITIGIVETMKFENFFVALPLFFYVPLTHFYYGIQFIRGFIKQDNLVSRLR